MINQKCSTRVKFGYFGGLDFLDNQASFNSVFGKNPVPLLTNVGNITVDCSLVVEDVKAYCDSCKLDVFSLPVEITILVAAIMTPVRLLWRSVMRFRN